MRELDFIPSWYPQTRRRKRMVILEAYMTFIVAAGLGLFVFQSQRNLRAEAAELNTLQTELSQSDSDLKRMDELLAMEKQLLQQDQIFKKIGLYIEVTRMLGTLQSIMPPEMALEGLSMKTVEQLKAVEGASKTGLKKAEQKLDRRLQVSIRGVAPTHIDVANFVVRLSGLPFFEQVSLGYGRDAVRNNHMMREFEVMFFLNLNSPGGK